MMQFFKTAKAWTRINPRFLPFADVATADLPLGRLLRLSLFQVTVGMAATLLIGTLNRVMIVEMGMSAWMVALMVALPSHLCAVSGADWLSLGYASLDFGLEARAVYLDWHLVAIRWLGHHALCPNFALGRYALANLV
jgi:hypothetical protein